MKNTRYFFTTTPKGVAFGGKTPKEGVRSFLNSLQGLLQNDCFVSAEFSFSDCNLFVRHLSRLERCPQGVKCDFWVLVKEFDRKGTTNI